MDFDEETQGKIQELQSLEQTLNSLLIQKQAFQLELSDTENALGEITKTSEDVFKLFGNIMIKSDKSEIENELKHKRELILLRLKSIERQESEIEKKAEELKEEVMKRINSK